METTLTIDGVCYRIWHTRLPEKFAPTVLCLVSYMPNKQTENLVRIAVASLQRHTTAPYTLCVVDNASPEERLAWLRQQKEVVLLENRTAPKNGSYANAVGLEIARRMIPADTRYFMSLHQDIMVTKDGWLEYLLGKFSDHIRAVGVREDRTRIPEGVLHVLGYIVDFQLVNALDLDYFPRLPKYDTGDYIIDELRKHGFGYFSTPNTQWHPELTQHVPEQLKLLVFDKHKVNFSFNNYGEVFFIHFSRGVIKTTDYKGSFEGYIDAWISVAKDILGNDCPQLYSRQLIYMISEKIKKFLLSRLNLFATLCSLRNSLKENTTSETKIFISPDDERKSYIELQTNRTLHKLPLLDSADVTRKRQRLDSIRNWLDLTSITHALVVGCRNSIEIDLLEEAGIKNVLGIDLVSTDKRIFTCDMHNISLIGDNSIEFIFSSHSLEHALYPLKVLQEFKRVLIPRGYVFIEVPIHFTPRGSDLHDFHSSDALESMLVQTWQGGTCLLKQEVEGEEINMGTPAARVVFQAPA